MNDKFDSEVRKEASRKGIVPVFTAVLTEACPVRPGLLHYK